MGDLYLFLFFVRVQIDENEQIYDRDYIYNFFLSSIFKNLKMEGISHFFFFCHYVSKCFFSFWGENNRKAQKKKEGIQKKGSVFNLGRYIKSFHLSHTMKFYLIPRLNTFSQFNFKRLYFERKQCFWYDIDESLALFNFFESISWPFSIF